MGWILFMVLAWSTALMLVPIRYWRKSWPVGIFGIAAIYAIDNTLAELGAFRFWHGGIYISYLPLYYWLGYFPGGIVFDCFRPKRHINRLIYVLVFAAGYLFVELVMIYFGYFQHLRWNAFKSLLLNVAGFTVSMWFAEWMEEGRNGGLST